jgi:hypothetical protein
MFRTDKDTAMRIASGIPTENDIKAVTMRATGQPQDLELVRLIFQMGNQLRLYDTRKIDAVFDAIARMEAGM